MPDSFDSSCGTPVWAPVVPEIIAISAPAAIARFFFILGQIRMASRTASTRTTTGNRAGSGVAEELTVAEYAAFVSRASAIKLPPLNGSPSYHCALKTKFPLLTYPEGAPGSHVSSNSPLLFIGSNGSVTVAPGATSGKSVVGQFEKC